MAGRARARVASELDWRPQSAAYVGVFDRLLRRTKAPLALASDDGMGHFYVDLDRDGELRRFVLARGPVPEQQPEQALGA